MSKPHFFPNFLRLRALLSINTRLGHPVCLALDQPTILDSRDKTAILVFMTSSRLVPLIFIAWKRVISYQQHP